MPNRSKKNLALNRQRRRQKTKIRGSKKRRVMHALFTRSNGKCEKCACPVGMAHKLLNDGWKLDKFGMLHSPAGESLALATIEHKIPLCRTGTDDPNNLALYCWKCNQDAEQASKKVPSRTGLHINQIVKVLRS